MKSAQPLTNAPTRHWKDAALAKAEGITDAWEVAKAYAGRAAEWVLFVCMIINIIEMLPGISLPGWVLNLVLSVQVVMLDIGGMSLGSMAAHAREQGDAAAAKKAGITSKFLIGLMILTLLLVAAGVLFPAIKSYTDMAEKALILVRVVMTVIYGHVIHSLRGSGHPVPTSPSPAVPDNAELETLIRDILVPVLAQYRTDTKADMEEQVKQMLSTLTRLKQDKAHQDELPAMSKEAKRKSSSAPVPIASMRQDAQLHASREARLSSAYQELLQEDIRPTGDTLSKRARCNRAVALQWLKTKQLAG